MEQEQPKKETTTPVSPSVLPDPIVLLQQAWTMYKVLFYRISPLLLVIFIAGAFQTILFLSIHQNPALYALGSLLATILTLVSYVALTLVIVDTESLLLDTSAAYQKAGLFIWSYIWLVVLTLFFTMGASILFLIPGIIVGVYFSVAVFPLMVEGKKGINALTQSWYYVRNNWWAVFGRIVVYIIASGIVSVIVGIFLSLLGIGHMGIEVHAQTSIVASIINQAVSTLFITPFGIMYMYLIYIYLRKQKPEELDVVGHSNIRKTLYIISLVGYILFIVGIAFAGVYITRHLNQFMHMSPSMAAVISSWK